MQLRNDSTPLPVLQNLHTCFAKDIGIAQFAECLVDEPYTCRYVLPFGKGYFCRHPHRELIVSATEKLQSMQHAADVF